MITMDGDWPVKFSLRRFLFKAALHANHVAYLLFGVRSFLTESSKAAVDPAHCLYVLIGFGCPLDDRQPIERINRVLQPLQRYIGHVGIKVDYVDDIGTGANGRQQRRIHDYASIHKDVAIYADRRKNSGDRR